MNDVSAFPTELRRSALGRVVVEVADADGVEEITYERRLPDAHLARQWCEAKVRASGRDAIREIQVFEEVWRRSGPWDASEPRPRRETIQVGATGPGGVMWASVSTIASMSRRRQLV